MQYKKKKIGEGMQEMDLNIAWKFKILFLEIKRTLFGLVFII